MDSEIENKQKMDFRINIYRVSQETWQLMNSLEYRLPNTGLDLKTFCSLVR